MFVFAARTPARLGIPLPVPEDVAAVETMRRRYQQLSFLGSQGSCNVAEMRVNLFFLYPQRL